MGSFGGHADALGEGLPLSYLFVATNPEAPPHSKETILTDWMSAPSSTCPKSMPFRIYGQQQAPAMPMAYPTSR